MGSIHPADWCLFMSLSLLKCLNGSKHKKTVARMNLQRSFYISIYYYFLKLKAKL